MAGKSDAFENALLKLIFWNTDLGGIGDAGGLRGSVAAGSLYIALHTGDPGEAGGQTSNEISYTGYQRMAIQRGAAYWDIVSNVVNPKTNIDFPASTGGTGGNATHVSIGTSASGPGMILYSGAISPVINVQNGVTPRILQATTITED